MPRLSACGRFCGVLYRAGVQRVDKKDLIGDLLKNEKTYIRKLHVEKKKEKATSYIA